ncbi:hypothetical protein [Domibacillus indicus]|uniref:hypothetical protein n=1 Tax=Domibacillus indicus TaxID=1437523 RepID=UPI000617AC5B|nr:hypothetical protein [Domibacillus indicus]
MIEKKHSFQSAAFTILYLDTDGIDRQDDKVLLTLLNPEKNRECQIQVQSMWFDRAFEMVNKVSGPYFAGGFVTRDGYNAMPEFTSFALVPISNYGAPVESTYERILYNHLSTHQRRVTRPFHKDVDHRWNGFIPDGLFIDTYPKTILEVFGISESDTTYHERRKAKIVQFSSLKPNYLFWYWDTYLKTKVPSLPPSFK